MSSLLLVKHSVRNAYHDYDDHDDKSLAGRTHSCNVVVDVD